MRVALISDMHGNLVALDTVLAEIDAEQPDLTVCLGDVAAMGPRPAACIEHIAALGCPVVRGNTDDALLSPPQTLPNDPRGRIIAEITQWCAAELTDTHREVLRGFQATVTVELDSTIDLLCFHGTPGSNTEIVMATTPDAEALRMMGGATQTLLAGGHTHQQLMRRLGGQWLVNPGSVGLTFRPTRTRQPAAAPPWAEYAMVDVRDGRLDLSLRAVPLDLAAVTAAAKESGMPHAEWWIAGWTERGGW